MYVLLPHILVSTVHGKRADLRVLSDLHHHDRNHVSYPWLGPPIQQEQACTWEWLDTMVIV